MDEAMHPLTLLCVGMYGETLPNQDGAPVRIVVPWKYGYKSIKSIVKIKFQEHEPVTTWNQMASNEYGFLFECESERGSSTLEPGNRAQVGRNFHSQDAAIQRLRRSGFFDV